MIGQDKKKNRELTQHTIKFFEKLLRASSDGIVITNAAHNIIVVNEAFCDFFRRQHREVIETYLFFWLEQLGANSLKRWAEMESRVHSEGLCHDTEFTLMTHEGIKYLSVNASLMEKVDAEEAGTIISIWRDITKQKQIEEELKILNKSLEQRVIEKTLALIKSNEELRVKIAEHKLFEEALRTSESKYRLLLENLPQKIFYKNKDSMYISCNENYAGDIRIKPYEIRGKTDYDFFPKALAEKYRADDKRIMESGKAEEIEEKYVKDGQEYIVHTVKTPVKDERGAIIGILGIFWDITEKIAMEKEAIRSRHLVSLGELAASVAHEVNNPITGVINYAQILCNKSNEGSKEKDIANRIIREGDRIASIVQSLLSFARISDKKEKKSIISVHEILSDTLILTKAQLRQEGIRIKLDIPQRLPEIVADPQQLQQVFLNAISNARYALNQKYPEAHDNKILEVLGGEMTIDNQQYVKITFYDHGMGIPAEIRDKIMDPFFTTKPRGKGTGLGLSISQSIIQDHHGKLTIESIEGEFTKVAIIFPVMVKTG
ncbi:MAG: Circadian input kinase A [Candidatus Jettenia ecosi]|uniref:histidine kinase n=1 Tax=Candidatus Jettenia ecosi TaxID=2494326 RepID=A0A533QL26_9BACT|nr:MAG: Circadian input kinase A [Candidatus Jettenia ecosi]